MYSNFTFIILVVNGSKIIEMYFISNLLLLNKLPNELELQNITIYYLTQILRGQKSDNGIIG